ncbi:MAG: cold shock domain-containing protein [Pseudomonadales bacterium]|nr:cold shock domain-containing protein [Pseudomonadales bacterium]
MFVGKVKWFNKNKGYGFIVSDDFRVDLFLHYSSIDEYGYRTLRVGQDVTFDVIYGPKGPVAVNVRLATANMERLAARHGVTPLRILVSDRISSKRTAELVDLLSALFGVDLELERTAPISPDPARKRAAQV